MVHLPAINTPQFSWGRNRMPEHAQPVPPIYQPEVPARAIHWAAHHRRRELFVGMPTVKAIEANKIIAPLLDSYLASKAYSGQQTAEPPKNERPDNLWEPADGPNGKDFGAHGIFDSRSRNFSPELWVSKNREWLGLAGVGIAGLSLGLRLGMKRK
jgi:hypothetical protein